MAVVRSLKQLFNEQKPTYILVGILFCIVFLVITTTLYALYVLFLEEQRERLIVTAQSQARLMEAVARFDAIYSEKDIPGGASEATLMQIREAHESFQGFGESGEFTIGRLSHDQSIEFLFMRSNRPSDTDRDRSTYPVIALGSENALPMQLALQGQSGTIIAKDYRGVQVLAAYEPVKRLNYGIVVKMDLTEIRHPYLQAATLSLLFGVALSMIGAIAFKRITLPIYLRIRENEYQLRLLLKSSGDAIYRITPDGVCTFANPACVALFGYQSEEELLGQNMHELTHHSHLDGTPYPKEECPILMAPWRETEIFRDDDHFWKADGSPMAVEYHSYPIYEKSKIVGAVVTFRDITARKAVEKERTQLMGNMQERIKELQCIYSITKVTRQYDNIDEMLNVAVKLLPPGWHYSDCAGAMICFDGKTFSEAPDESRFWTQSCELIIKDQVRGLIEVGYSSQLPELDQGPFLHQERNLLKSITQILSEAIERIEAQTELEKMASHDHLTGLFNRQAMSERVKDEITRAERYSHNLSVLMIDLDLFKRINDNYGHVSGDNALQKFADQLKTLIRDTDVAVRYGGEEFLIILPETSQAEAHKLAERIRQNIEETAFLSIHDEPLKITCSIGIATYPEHANNWERLLNQADSALYKAKNKGRNCSELAES